MVRQAAHVHLPSCFLAGAGYSEAYGWEGYKSGACSLATLCRSPSVEHLKTILLSTWRSLQALKTP